MADSVRAFAPMLGPLISSLAHRPWPVVASDPPELCRVVIEAMQLTGATHVVTPIDALTVAAACALDGVQVVDDELDLSQAMFADLREFEPADALASPWVAPMLKLAEIASAQARVAVAIRMPSPARLVEEVGIRVPDADALLSADDICSSLALGLLRAGASLILVDPSRGVANDASVRVVERAAEPFGVPVLDTSSSGVRWLDLSATGWDPRDADVVGDFVLIPDRPIRPGDDFAGLREMGSVVAR